MAMNEFFVDRLVPEDRTTPYYGDTVVEVPVEVKSWSMVSVVSAGTGTVSCDLEGSIDGATWHWVGNASQASVTTTATSVAGTVTNAYRYFRANLYGLTGTDCTVNFFLSYID